MTMRTLYLDCFSGISGDMTVGALADLGVPADVFEQAAAALALPELSVRVEPGENGGICGTRFVVDDPEISSHDADQHHHHRDYRSIREMIERSELVESVKRRALAVFRRIAVAEGRIHGIQVEKVHFHEVGALDSIADIVCACAGFEWLKVDRVHCSVLREGHGLVECAHGKFPIPSPATVEILAGIPLEPMGEPYEFVTPTGAGIVAEYAESYGPMPPTVIEKTGYGLGTRVIRGRANVLRMILGESAGTAAGSGYETDQVVVMETNIDDASPEIIGASLDRLFEAGALDAFFVPVQMKKNRPGVLLTVLCDESARTRLADLILRETTAFGLRMHRADRVKLGRRIEPVETPYGKVDVKIGFKGEKVLQVAPEFESYRQAARNAGVPLHVVRDAARAAWFGKT